MSSITPERRIAIAFIRFFRKSLDETLKPNNITNAYGEPQVKQAMKFLFGNFMTPPPGIEDYLLDLFEEMNADFKIHMEKQYDELLPGIISTTMTELEKHFKEKFSEAELNELSALTDNETVMKLLSGLEIFNIFRKERFHMYESLDEAILAYTTRTEVKERLANAVQEFINRPKLDDNNSDEDDHGSLDPGDIFN